MACSFNGLLNFQIKHLMMFAPPEPLQTQLLRQFSDRDSDSDNGNHPTITKYGTSGETDINS